MEMFPVTKKFSRSVESTFPTWGASGMVTLIVLPVGKFICVSLRTNIPIL